MPLLIRIRMFRGKALVAEELNNASSSDAVSGDRPTKRPKYFSRQYFCSEPPVLPTTLIGRVSGARINQREPIILDPEKRQLPKTLTEFLRRLRRRRRETPAGLPMFFVTRAACHTEICQPSFFDSSAQRLVGFIICCRLHQLTVGVMRRDDSKFFWPSIDGHRGAKKNLRKLGG